MKQSVKKITLGTAALYCRLSRGDNINNESNSIKRVVAVAGDTVQLKDSRVYINHVYLSPYTCDADTAAAYNLEADHYFVLGDNDGASIDSRDFGIISKEHIIGKVILF